MKCIRFQEGLEIPIYSWENDLTFPANTPMVISMKNFAFLYDLVNLNGVYHDYDGNTWEFTSTEYTHLKIINRSGQTVYDANLNGSYYKASCFYFEKNNDSYNIILRRNTSFMTYYVPSSPPYTPQITAAYVNGVNDTHYLDADYLWYFEDQNPQDKHYEFVYLANIVQDSAALPSTVIYYRNDQPLQTSELQFYILNIFGGIGSYGGNPIVTLDNSVDEISKPNDPYAGGNVTNYSGHGGGKGTFFRSGDTIGEHGVPTLSAVDAGFITLFAPTRGEMQALCNYLWSPAFSIETFKKIFANPMDCILGLSIVPVSVPTGGSATIHVGNISTGVSMTKASTQYVKLSCGSLEVKEYWGSYLDYSPYTKVEIFLPYIGMHQLSLDDVMGKTVKVVYYIDILSGACTAEIYSNGTCTYTFNGQCASSIPITGNDWTNVINGILGVAGAAIGAIATGGLTAPLSAAGAGAAAANALSNAGTVAASKPSVERSGSMAGTGGMLSQQSPFLIITWPKLCLPEEQNNFIGYPSFTNVTLGSLSGFNSVQSIHLNNIPATDDEITEITNLLMEGVIF